MRRQLKPLRLIPTRIKGHQDDDDGFILEESSLPVQCNIEMDENAKKFLLTHQGQFEPTTKASPLPAMNSWLEVHGSTVQNNIDHHVRLHFFGPKLEARLFQKTDLNSQSLQMINWLAIERAYKKQPLQDKCAIFQLIHKKWYTHMDIARWDCEKNPICPRCNAIEETFHHIFQCQSAHATRSHKNAVVKLKDGLHKSHTAPIIQRAILQCVDQHQKGYEDLRFMDLVVDDETKLLLGPTAFLQGYISKDWSLLQNAYDGSKDVSDDRVDWASKVIKHIWTYSITSWKDRCDEIHGVNGGKTTSIKRIKINHRSSK